MFPAVQNKSTGRLHLGNCAIVQRSNELAIIRTKKDGTPSSTLVELYQDAEANGICNWPDIQGKRERNILM